MRYYILLFILLLNYPAFGQIKDRQPQGNTVTDACRRQITDLVQQQLAKIDWNHTERATSGRVDFTIPVVVHVLHDYGAELLPDSTIYAMIEEINAHFLKTTPDTANIIEKFKAVAASTKIKFKLATIDPTGNPTKGIEHIFTYLTYGNTFAPDQQKINQWPQSKYLNVWLINNIDGISGVTYYTPYAAAYHPFYDGIALMSYLSNYMDLSSFFARYLNLPYPCNYDGPGAPCTDNDGIPDTPPCGNDYFVDCSHIYDTTCDTPNQQNIMVNYDSCAIMFTYGQGQYMQTILQLDYGHRDSLVSSSNFAATGMNQPMPDLPPVADFDASPVSYPYGTTRFYCEHQNVRFTDHSWNDTIIGVSWNFSNEPLTATSSSRQLVNQFSQPGWVTVALSATGNNTGTTTLTDNAAIYVADTVATNAIGYIQEFNPGAGMDTWPMFNYYYNNFKWQPAGVGYYDNTCIEYTAYDYRDFPEDATGTPAGDFDDFFTPAFDLSGFPGECYLHFLTSGACSNPLPVYMNDSLEVDYSTDFAKTWRVLKVLKKYELDNMGATPLPYTPSSQGDWVAQTIPFTTFSGAQHIYFRFRYHPGADSSGYSTGNNFYLDRFYIDGFPADVANIIQGSEGAVIAPNPTHEGTFAILKSAGNIGRVSIVVTDVTGSKVFATGTTIDNTTGKVEIPAHAITPKGVYLVHIVTSAINQTAKLIVD